MWTIEKGTCDDCSRFLKGSQNIHRLGELMLCIRCKTIRRSAEKLIVVVNGRRANQVSHYAHPSRR